MDKCEVENLIGALIAEHGVPAVAARVVSRGRKVTRKCKWRGCRRDFEVRAAAVKRGWGNFCSKRCKADEQESRTGQNAVYLARRHGGYCGPSGVSATKVRHYAHEYGGIPCFDGRGEYEGFAGMPESSD